MQAPDLDGLIIFIWISIFILFPLGFWKIIDIVIWLIKNIHINIGG